MCYSQLYHKPALPFNSKNEPTYNAAFEIDPATFSPIHLMQQNVRVA